ncbi:MAG TPA: flagellar filament capping protein FliD [Capsulimonadaceae bacterium]|jgi:flagellar hook-associated protein 2
MASSAITISGLASGLDTTSIITALTSAENTAITRQTTKQSALKSKLATWQTYNANLLALQSATVSLSTQAAYGSSSATSSNGGVATVTASSGAAAGTHNLSVTTLAQNQQVLSGSQSDSSTPLGFGGTFELNGKSITVANSDTLASVATAINNANTGVTAKVITVSAGNVKLSLSSNNTGTLNSISAADLGSDTVLKQLGFVSAASTTAIRQSVTSNTGATGAGSLALNSSTTALGSLLNGSTSTVTAPSGTVKINGTDVALDLNTMSLNDVANAINSAGITDVTAQVIGVPDSAGNITASSKRQIQIVSGSGAVTASSFTDSNGVLASLGITQQSFTNQVAGAQDATFTVDNVAYTRSTNSVNDVIPNVSMTLLSQGTVGSPVTSTITVTQDTSAAQSAIQNLVSSYNTINQFVNDQNTFTPPTNASSGEATASPDLFGDYTLISMQQQLGKTFSNAVNGKTMSDIGVTMGTDGSVTIDSTKLSKALQADSKSVYQLFGVSGTTTNTAVTFASATNATKASSGAGYPVQITTPASQGQVTAGTAQTSASTAAETLTFNGKAFGSTAYKLTAPSGTTQAALANLINTNVTLSQLLYATVDSTSGKMSITSKAFGIAGSFNVTSSLTAATDNSGIGTTTIWGAGADVSGTINGEAATGLGQTLTGKAGNVNTEGLVLKITATAAGSYGSAAVTHGIANQLSSLVDSFTSGKLSPINAAEDSINSQINDIDTQVTQMQTSLEKYKAQLTDTFNNMETQMSKLKAQSDAFNAQSGTVSSTTSTKKTSS